MLKIRTLGGLELRYGDDPLPVPPTIKARSLLAYLVVHRNRSQPRDRVADLFWGDRPEHKARHSLATALWHIRRCLPKDYILSDNQAVQFDPQADLWLDVDEFESYSSADDISCLQSAVALYRGDFLDGFYDDWIINERYRLETLFTQALARLMVAREGEEDHESALHAALRLLEHDPLREDAHRLAMLAYCRLGQRDAALAQYRRCREIVRGELDAEPMRETTELYQAILEGWFAVEPAPPRATTRRSLPDARPPLHAGRNPLDVLTAGPLVGRERELALLQECWQAAVSRVGRGTEAGQGALVLIRGEAGVGKTRLVKEFAHRLHWQGQRVLWGRCYEFERVLPYQPIAEALGSIVSWLTPAELADFPTWTLEQIARLVPEVLEKQPGLRVTPSIRSEQERARLFEGVARFLIGLTAHEALLLVQEDLHWASESTLQLIHYLARHAADQALLLVGTFRSEAAVGPGHPVRTLQQQLSQERIVRPLRLARLTPTEVETIVEEMSGAGAAVLPLARRLYQETEGNPFFLMEIVKALFETGLLHLKGGAWSGEFTRISTGKLPLPASLSEAIQARARGLSLDGQKALRLAAVLGREFDFDLLDAVWGRGSEATLEVLDDLLRRQLVEEGSGVAGRDYAFIHHKIQEAIYAGIPRRHRGYAHAQVGAAIERLYASQLGELVGELAHHFEQGCQHDMALSGKAIDYLLQAGDRARRSYLCAETLRYYTRALALAEKAGLPDVDALVASIRARRGEVCASIDDNAGAKRDFYHVLAWSRQAGERHREAETLLDLVKPHLAGHELESAMACAQDAYAIAASLADDSLIARSTGALGSALCVSGDLDQAHHYLQTALGAGRASGAAEMLSEVLFYSSMARNWMGDFQASLTLLEELLSLAEQVQSPVFAYAALFLQAIACCGAGAYDQALEAVAQSGAMARKAGIATAPAELLNTEGWVHQEIYDLHTSLRLNAEGAKVAQDLGEIESEANALVNLGVDHLWLGDLDQADRCFVEAWALLDRQFGGYRWRWKTRLLAAWGELYLARGDAMEALGYADRCLKLAVRTSSRKNLVKGWRLRGEALADLGRLDEAADELGQAVVAAEEIGNPPLIWKSHFSLGQVLEHQGRSLEAGREYQMAVDAIEATAAGLRDADLRESFLRAGPVCAVCAARSRLHS
jgi:predicted ATPase/DNA-binding SARP family transcriptional activator